MIELAGLLFYEFFKIGLFAVGGGPATIPYLMDLTVSRPWFSMQQLTDMIAIAESTPGPIGLNMATYAGVSTLGIWGGLVATLGLVMPSVIVIILIAKFLENFNENRFVKAAFYAIRPAVAGLIGAAVYSLASVSLFEIDEAGAMHPAIPTIILAVVIFGLLQVKQLQKLHPVFWFIGAAVIGIVFRF